MQLLQDGTWGADYEEWEQGQNAVHDGIAVELFPCYMCLPDVNDRVHRPETGPLRGVLSSFVNRDVADPTWVMVLSCGHQVI